MKQNCMHNGIYSLKHMHFLNPNDHCLDLKNNSNLKDALKVTTNELHSSNEIPLLCVCNFDCS